MINILGIGWIEKKEYGIVKKNKNYQYKNIDFLYNELKNKKILSNSIKNFNRFPINTKLVCCNIALALYDAGMINRKNLDVGIIGTNIKGALKENINYFEDYVNSGRVLSRGNLFIYTLPSSSLAEASIHFSLQGSLVYVNYAKDNLLEIIKNIKHNFLLYGYKTMIIIDFSKNKSICLVVSYKNKAKKTICFLETFEKIIEKHIEYKKIVSELI